MILNKQAKSRAPSSALGTSVEWPFPRWPLPTNPDLPHSEPPTTDQPLTRTRTHADMTTELGEAKW